MQFPISLDTFIGNARAVEILKRAIKRGRVPHAMIFAGPSGVGKCTLALLMAQYLNCPFQLENGPCGACPTCNRIRAVIDSRHLQCENSKSGEYCGSCSACRIRTKRHPDIRLIEPEKTTISIDQVRDLIGEVAYQPLEARYRVVILDPAEQMRPEAHNSLLKTLEEPPSRTIIVLVTSNPYVLLGTIRSRCRMLQFGEIPQDRIEQFLVSRAGRTVEESRLAAALSGGSLAAALDFNTEEYRDIRRDAFEFVELMLRRGKFSEASALAARAAKDKNIFQLWIESVAALLQDVYYARPAAGRVGQRDMLEKMKSLSGSVPHSRLVYAIECIGQLKSRLFYNVNRQIALEAVFLELARHA